MVNNKPSKSVSASVQLGLTGRGGGARRKSRRRPSKSRRKRPGPQRALVARPQLNMADVERTCSILDPFCPAAVGARLSGDGGIYTIPMSSHWVASVTTNTAQAVAFIFYPDWNYGYAITTAVAGTFTFPALSKWPIGGGGYTDDYMIEGRVVSAGFIVRNTSQAMTVSNSYLILPLNRVTVTDTMSSTTLSFADPRTQLIQATKSGETAVVSLRRGSGALDFHTALDGTGAQPDYQPWMVMFQPTPAGTNTYEIECFIHTEGVLKTTKQEIQNFVTSKGASVSPKVRDAADNAASKMTQVITKSAGNAATAFGKEVAKQAFSALVGAAAGYVTKSPTTALVAYQGTKSVWSGVQEVD